MKDANINYYGINSIYLFFTSATWMTAQARHFAATSCLNWYLVNPNANPITASCYVGRHRRRSVSRSAFKIKTTQENSYGAFKHQAFLSLTIVRYYYKETLSPLIQLDLSNRWKEIRRRAIAKVEVGSTASNIIRKAITGELSPISSKLISLQYISKSPDNTLIKMSP